MPSQDVYPLLRTGAATGANKERRQLANIDTAALITLAAAGISTVNGIDQANVNGRGVKVVVDITALGGTGPTLVVRIQGKDAASGKYYSILASASLVAVATTVLTVYPGLPFVANVTANDVLPATWRVTADVTGTGPAVTATIGASVIW